MVEIDGKIQDLGDYCSKNTGMSLRDWFAGMALQGVAAIEDPSEIIKVDATVRRAYLYADAMLTARDHTDTGKAM